MWFSLLLACADPAPVTPAPAPEPTAAAAPASAPKSTKDDGVVSGQIAPALSLPVVGEANTTWTLSDYVNTAGTGRADGVVVAFMASWCGVCKTALPTLAELETQYNARVEFVVVTTDDSDDKRKQELDILRKGGVKAPLLAIDAPTQTAWLGSSRSIPRFVFVDKLGKVMVQDRGFGAKVKPLMPKQMLSLLERADRL